MTRRTHRAIGDLKFQIKFQIKVRACLATGDRIFATGSDSVSKIGFAILCQFLLDLGVCNHGLKGPQKPKTYCDNGILRSYLSPSVFIVRSGSVWRQDLAILSWDSPDPRQGPEDPFLEKRVWGPKTPISPHPGKGSFLSKCPFFYKGTQGKWGFFDRKLPFPGRMRASGLDPETLFSRKWGFGALSGVGGILRPCLQKGPATTLANYDSKSKFTITHFCRLLRI